MIVCRYVSTACGHEAQPISAADLHCALDAAERACAADELCAHGLCKRWMLPHMIASSPERLIAVCHQGTYVRIW